MPHESEIRRLHEATAAQRNAERNSLILSWPEEKGAHRADLNRILLTPMPSLETLDELLDTDGRHSIQIVRKSGKLLPIKGEPRLLLRTIDCLDNERRAPVANMRAIDPEYREPPEVFLSERTGLTLHLDSITAMARSIFRTADTSRASLPRLRAKHCVDVVEALVDALLGPEAPVHAAAALAETILNKAAKAMGHGSPSSLRPDLTHVLNRRLRADHAMTAMTTFACARQMAMRADVIVARQSA